MTTALITVGVFVGLYILLNMKTSRPDGTLVRYVHPYRRIMAYIMPTRNESVYYYNIDISADNLLRYIQDAKGKFDCNITHVLIGVVIRTMAMHPKMNQFVLGRRLYQRKGIWVTFSMKRKKMDKESKLATVKIRAKAGENFQQLCERVNESIGYQRSDTSTYADKEFALFLALPRPVLRLGIRLMYWMDYHNIMPGSFIDSDPMYTTAFLSNIGSLKGAEIGYHHLYEWGTASHFFNAGQIEERPVVRDGRVVVEKVLPLRCSYDERIDDGLTARAGSEELRRILSDPAKYLGCIAPDGSDRQAVCQTDD